MATIDPPYRLDPLQNPVKVKGEPEGGPPPVPGSEDCWALFSSLFINPDISETLRWPKNIGGYTTNPGEAAGSFGKTIWYVDAANIIVCFDWNWLSGTECGFVPGPEDTPPAAPPDDWEGHNFSPNSEE